MKRDISIDLHIHFDGSISCKSARELADMQGISLPQNEAELIKILSVGEDCHSLAEYLEKFDFPLSLLQIPEAIEKGMETLCRELKHSGTIYSEIRFAPQLHTKQGLTQREVVISAISGFEKSGLCGGLILCCMRGDTNMQANIETINVAKDFLNKGVFAIDLAGNEAGYPTKNYGELFSLAKANGIPFTIHAGEADGAQSVKYAIEMGASRIGHGVRSIEDREVMQMLASKQIPLEVCPTSNINTAIFSEISEFPLKALLASGIIVTVNSDNRSVSNTDALRERKCLIKSFNLTEEDEKELLYNSVNAAFGCEETKEKLKKIIDNCFDKNL